jgi:glycosyltransferase involved in cell wall biosynthesis
MKIFVFGTRGFPDIQGGVEKHCELLYTALSKSYPIEIYVFRRKSYVLNKIKKKDNIRFIDLPSTKITGIEAFIHSFLATVYSIAKRPDIVHVHNIGPGFFILLLNIFKIKTILTYHSPNYEHQKWNFLVKKYLKISEFISLRFSKKIIFVSQYQKNKVANNIVKASVIYNGVEIIKKTSQADFIDKLGLKSQKYVIAVGRFVPEKGFHDLISAFAALKQNQFKLVLVGDADHETDYSKSLKEKALINGVVLTGYIKDEKLNQIFSHAALFVMPSYHEGLPIALLEAMSYDLNIIVSDIPQNLEIGLDSSFYFKSGHIEELTDKIKNSLASNNINKYKELLGTKYNWENIAEQTFKLYEEMMK